MTASQPMMMVPMREATVALLMARRRSPNEPLDAVAARLAAPAPADIPRPAPAQAGADVAAVGAESHRVDLLGLTVRAHTLGRLFAAVVDAIHDLDPSVIERLANRRARTRRFVARERFDVHGGRHDLPTLRTRTGWWVSANVGERDVRRALRALCAAAELSYGRDLVFPAPGAAAV